jgi:N-acetylneuraminate lyase
MRCIPACQTPSLSCVLVSVAQWLEGVAKVVPTLPLYYYHIAIMTGVNIRMDQLLEAIHGRIPSFRGLKFSDADLHVYGNCVAYQGGLYDVLYGKDEQFLGALAMGGTGAVGSTYNYMVCCLLPLLPCL